MTRSAILALGMYAPPEVRTNDWWPAEVVERWRELRARAPTASHDRSGLTRGAKRVLDAAARYQRDPFGGAVERRILAAELTPTDAAERAASDAIARAKIDPTQIDLLITHTAVADHALVNPACPLHERLGLAPSCLAFETEATGYSAFAQIAIADAAIASGRARHAVLVQTCVSTRLVDDTDPGAPILGDGATAIVMGAASDDRGIVGTAHFTEGRYPDSLVMAVPGGRWYDEGRPRVHVASPAQLGQAHLRTADSCAEAVIAALKRADQTLDDVDFLCVGQGTPWLHEVVAEELGLEGLPTVEIFRRFAYLGSALVPAALFQAEQVGHLADNDLVVLVGGGTGMTYGAIAMRWRR